MRALVVDDSTVMRRILARQLTELGFTCVEATDGRAALEVCKSGERFDITLIDWNMPVMNGLELVKALRADPEHVLDKLVMVTSEAGVNYIQQALGAGADEYLMKPFTREVLVEKLTALGVPVVTPKP